MTLLDGPLAHLPFGDVSNDLVDTVDPVTTTKLVIPRWGTLQFQRDRASGSLLAIDAGDRRHLTVAENGWCWHNICTTSEHVEADGMTRTVTTAQGEWKEHYRWTGGALHEVDGVTVRRDEHGRVIACLAIDEAVAEHRWFYSYDDRGIAHIRGPNCQRWVSTAADGRVLATDEAGITTTYTYDRLAHLVGSARPLHDHIDEAGRRWAAVDRATGEVRSVFIWDGTRCLARIDGPLGSPTAAVFSLDPSGTPVRIVTTTMVTRVPRDAYGEGLLAHRDVPGLYGGQIAGGLVHLPLRRLNPRTGSFCEPDPLDGGDDDLRRAGNYPGPLPTELEPRSAYEVCRGDPIGRADPTGGVSVGLVISDLTWSFQNNLLTFFGIDWWFNLFASLIVAPFKGIGDGIDYDFFSSTGLSGSEGHGGFGLRRGGIINAITGGRAFATQHVIWAPDRAFEQLEQGEVIDPGGRFVPTHYGTILRATPSDHAPLLLASMDFTFGNWATNTGLAMWTRHGGPATPVAPGTLTPWFPSGGLHLDTALTTTRGDVSCALDELESTAVGIADLEERSFLTVPTETGLAASDQILVDDGTNLETSTVLAVIGLGGAQRLQLDSELTSLATSGLRITQVIAAGTSESLPAGAVANSIDVSGTTETYAANDLLRLSDSAAPPLVTVGRIDRLEARLSLERPLPGGFGGPITVTRGAVAAPVTIAVSGANLDFATVPRPAIGSTGLLGGGTTEIAVQVTSHDGTTEVGIDVAIPGDIAAAPLVTYRPVNAGSTLGTRTDAAEPDPVLTYTPTVAGAAPDGSTTTIVVHCTSGTESHARVLGAPVHDVLVLDRTIAGAAPFDTERLGTTGATITDGSRLEAMAMVVDEPARFSSAAAVYAVKVQGEPPTAGATALNGDVVEGVLVDGPGPVVGGIDVGRPMLVGDRATCVRGVRLTVNFDRAFDLSRDDLSLARLRPTGHVYEGVVAAADEIIVQPQIQLGGGAVEVPFPRFEDGDLAQVNTPGGATWHRVATASGGRLELIDGPTLTVGDAISVRHVVTADPGHGGVFLAFDGTRIGDRATTEATFSVWASDALPTGMAVGIIDGDITHPTQIAGGGQTLEVTFSETFDAASANLAPLTPVTDATGAPVDRFLPRVALDGGVLLLEGAPGNLETAPGESLIVVAYEPSGTATGATLGPGTLLVPERESVEVDRSQALEDHELEHTLQYARWGPLWFNIFPMLAMELPGILRTDTELPEYSRFLDATVAIGTADRWNLTINDTGGVSIDVGDELQVVQGARRSRVSVHSISGATFEVRAITSPPTAGTASVRKQQRASVFDGFYAFFDLLTHGGLMNLVAGSTWGGIFWLIGKGIYGLGRAIGGTGELYPATVLDGGGGVTLTDPTDVSKFNSGGAVIVRQGDNSVVRTMARNATVMTFTEPVTFTGDVLIAVYDRHDPGSAFDWYDYYPATVDPDNQFTITVAPVGDNNIGLSPEDRVQITYQNVVPFKTDVLAVNGNEVELRDPVVISNNETSLRIAKVGASDPLGNADSTAMVEMGMGWMKWIFDPYGQIEYAASPDEEWARWLLRVMRWLLGTQNFSLLPGGYLWWGRLIPLIVGPEHVTPIEQEASENSGNLYSPLGRVHGQRSNDGFGRHRMVVGDVARYRYWPLLDTTSFVTGGQLGRPRVSFQDNFVRILPNRDASGGAAGEPNQNVIVGPDPEPGRSVAEIFSNRPLADPRVVPNLPPPPPPTPPPVPPIPDPLGFGPSDLGNVPVSARTQGMVSTYFSFTRPGDHRVTTINNILGAQTARDAFDRERQTLFYDITADDVTVTVAGQPVDAGDVVPLIPFQVAATDVTPNGTRAYRVALTEPDGPVAQIEGAANLVGVAASPDPVPVEVSRFYRVNGGSYGPGGLAMAGMHLGRPVHIPVRRFAVRVDDTLPIRASADPGVDPVPSVAISEEAFLLVPAPVTTPPSVTSIAGSAPAAGAASPFSRADAVNASSFLGATGAAYRIRFPTGTPTGEVIVSVTVGDGVSSAVLTATFALTA